MTYPNEMFYVQVEKDYIGFASAHFITYDGHKCETLHGHNYRVRIAMGGPLDENYYVVDFVRTKRMMKMICDEIDHVVLLPLHNSLIELEVGEESVSARYKDSHYRISAFRRCPSAYSQHNVRNVGHLYLRPRPRRAGKAERARSFVD